MSWLTDFAEYLEDQGAGTVGTNLFVNRLPDSPAVAAAVYDAGGDPSPHGVDVPWYEHQAEIRVRAASFAAAQTAADTYLSKIDHKQNITMNGSTVVHWIRPITAPAFLEYDKERRAVFLIRVIMHVQRSELYTA